MLGGEQRKTLFLLVDVLRDLLSESLKPESLPSLQERLDVTLALVERDFPVSLQVRYTTVGLNYM